MVTHLICDCDGVLIDSESISLEVLVEELGRHLPGRDLTVALSARMGLPLQNLLEEMAAEFGFSLAGIDVPGLDRRLEQEIAQRVGPVRGVAEALDAIALPTAVASNSNGPRVRETLQRAGLWSRFEGRVFTADVVGAPKPQPDVYLAACSAFGVAPGACVVVEDSVTGVTAAAAAGMRVLGFTGAGHVTPGLDQRLLAAGAIQIFTEMRALPALIRDMRTANASRALSN